MSMVMMMSVVLFLGRGTRNSDVFKVKMLSDVFFLSRSVVVVVDWWPMVTFHHSTMNLSIPPAFVSSNTIYVIKDDGRW